MARESDDCYRVEPFDLVGCDGVGATLDEATETARAALKDYFKGRTREFIVPPSVAFDPDELERGVVTRIEISLYD